jgi:hypothetical protein
MKPRLSFLAAFVALVLSMLFSAPVWAQVAGATLSGTVTDTSGAIIPQAHISIKNVATGITTTAAANSEGAYTAPNLLPGSYEMTTTAPGFTTEVRRGITLTVGAQQVLNFTLRVGQVTEKVQVTGEAPAVQLASSSISAVVGANSVVELPLNGRDWTQLAALQPGVNRILTQQSNVGGSLAQRGYGQEMTISGTRPQLNNYRLDGISVVDYAGGSPGSVLGVALGVDAIAEFSVLTSNASAEYGRTSGGVINAITRSGTNQIHGDAYWFLRDEALDAANFFDNAGGIPKPSFHRNQFGASAGGPIQKDKTFFFADYEGFRQGLGTTNVNKVPSADARNGIVHNDDGTTCTIGVPSPGCTLTNSAGTVGVDPMVKPFLGFYPLPNAGLIGTGNTGLFDVAGKSNLRENFVTARVDRKFSEKDSISGSWFWDKGLNQNADNLNNQVYASTSFRTMIGLEETHVFSPTLVNSMRGGFSRVWAFPEKSVQAINPLVTDASLGSFAGRDAPKISVTGLSPFQGGFAALSTNAYYWNSFQAYDDAFLTKGVHSIKFGFAFERMQLNREVFADNGQFTFGTLEAFLANQPSTFSGTSPTDVSPRGVRQDLFGGYLQDDWRWRPNLTLNLGLRYEMVTVPTEVQGKLTNLLTFTSPTPHLGSPYFNNPTLRDFEPRVGFSWDPFHNGKTAVRGAFGIFDVLPLNYEFVSAYSVSAPFTKTLTATNLVPGSFPTGIVNTLLAAGIPASSQQSASIEFNPHRNYLMLWNLNIQRQLTPSTTVMVGYVGNHGVHMLDRADDVNLVLPQATPQGYLWPSPVGSGTRLNPNIGDIRGEYFGGDSEYAALEVQVSKRMSHGFQAQGSYTWGKGIDTGSASLLGDPFINSISSLFWFCKSCRRGLSDYNIAHTLVVNYLWDVPTPKNWGGVGSHLLGGWALGGIFTAETGVPMTPILGGDALGLNSNDPWDFPNRLTGPGCQSLVNPGNPNNYIKLNCFAPANPINLLGNAGRNIVVGPGLATFDFSLFKNNYIKRISESFNAQFRAEFFNALNRANFGTPVNNSALFDSSGNPVGGAGAVDTTSTTAREIQFALKLIW